MSVLAGSRLRRCGWLAVFVVFGPSVSAQWIEFQEETATRLVADPGLGTEDPREKDYAWGDVDRDGDVDLVVVRKEPLTTPGKDPNLLFINEDGTLTDRTAEFATASDVPGDLGFSTPTNDRDVQLVDVDLDGWLDIVTAPTYSDGDPKAIGHPRIYINLGCSGACATTDDWLGFRYEEARIPALLSWTGESGFNPRFCHVATGDVTADGYPDLWFADYNEGQPEGADFNDKLLVNLGASNPGFFVDATATSFAGVVPGFGDPFPVSAFGAAGAVADFNGDGSNDILKQHPPYVGVAYNEPLADGLFDTYDVVNQMSPYFASVGDLNNDGSPDLVITDDGSDRFLLNQGNGDDDIADFVSHLFDFENTEGGEDPDDGGVGGNSLIADLNNDGWNDVLIADMDPNRCCCGRRIQIYKNLGGFVGGPVTLQEQATGANCAAIWGNPPTCVVASIPADQLEGVHDVAVFDLDGDGWQDMVIGQCDGTRIFINQGYPPAGRVPDGGEEPGQPLLIAKVPDILPRISLSWGDSCHIDDTDYEIYEGTIGEYGSHVWKYCSTAGALSQEFIIDPNTSKYYLVVPTNGEAEGSYGTDSQGIPRQRGPSACRPHSVAVCE